MAASVPAALASSDVELWLIRAPIDFDASSIDKQTLKLKLGVEHTAGSRACVLTERAADADSDDDTVAYNLVEGDSNEAERLLNLFPHAKYANQLVPGKPFSRCFSVVAAKPSLAPESHAAAVGSSPITFGRKPLVVAPKVPATLFTPSGYGSTCPAAGDVSAAKAAKHSKKRKSSHRDADGDAVARAVTAAPAGRRSETDDAAGDAEDADRAAKREKKDKKSHKKKRARE